MLWAILLISIALRVSLIVSGGQDYWPDEDTANPGHILEALIAHDYGTVFSRLDRPDRVLGRPPPVATMRQPEHQPSPISSVALIPKWSLG